MRNMKRVFAIFLVLVMVFSLSGTAVFARSQDEAKKELEQKQNKLETVKERDQSEQTDMKKTKAKIRQKENEVDALSAEIAEKQRQITDTKNKLIKKKEELENQIDGLNKRLRNMYKNGSIGFVDVVLSSENVDDLISNLEMVKRIYSSDRDLVKRLQKEYAAIEKLEKKLEQEKADQDEKLKQLSEKKAALDQEYKRLAASNKQTKKEEDALESDIMDLKVEAGLVASSTASYGEYTGTSTGQFIWPLAGHAGTVTSGYGYRWGKLHAGVDIAAPTGTPVVAVDDGKVVFASWTNDGGGNMVIISHGNGLWTLYAHNSRLTCSAGQNVSRGQKIAEVGMTGFATGPHVHFAVRKGSNQYNCEVNPMNYL